jgi:hypothetical protein
MEAGSFLPLGRGCQLLAFLAVSKPFGNVPVLSSLEMSPTLAISEEVAVGRTAMSARELKRDAVLGRVKAGSCAHVHQSRGRHRPRERSF